MNVSFRVSSMKCGGCANNIRAVLSRQPGIRQVIADPAAKTVRVDFDEARTGTPAIEAALAGAGFPAELQVAKGTCRDD